MKPSNDDNDRSNYISINKIVLESWEKIETKMSETETPCHSFYILFSFINVFFFFIIRIT